MFSQSIIVSFSFLLAIGSGLVTATQSNYSENNSTYDKIVKDEYSSFFPTYRNDELKLESPNVSSHTVDRIQPDPSPPVADSVFNYSDFNADEFIKYLQLIANNATQCDKSSSPDQGIKIASSFKSNGSRNDTWTSISPPSAASEKTFTEFNLTNKNEAQHPATQPCGVPDDCKQVKQASGQEQTLNNNSTMKCKRCKQPFSCLGDKLANLREGDSESYFVTERTKGNEDQMNENSDPMLIEEYAECHISNGTDNVVIPLGNTTCHHKSSSSGQDEDIPWGSGRNYIVRSRIQEMFVDPKFEGTDSDYSLTLYKSIKEYIFPKPHFKMIRSINLHNANETVGNSCIQNLLRTLVKGTNRNSSLAIKAGVDDTNTSIASVMTRCNAETTPAKVNLTDGTVGTEMNTEDKGASVIEKRKEELEPNTTVHEPMNFPSHGDVSDDKSNSGPVSTVLNSKTAAAENASLLYGNSIERVGNLSSNRNTPAAKLEDKNNITVATGKAISNSKLSAAAKNHVGDANSTMGVQITPDIFGSEVVESDKERVSIVMDDANKNLTGQPKIPEAGSRLISEDDGNVDGLTVERKQYSNKNTLMDLIKQEQLAEKHGALSDNVNIVINTSPITHLETDDIVEFLSRLKLKSDQQDAY